MTREETGAEYDYAADHAPQPPQLHDWNGDNGRECACPECCAKRRRLYLEWAKGAGLPERR